MPGRGQTQDRHGPVGDAFQGRQQRVAVLRRPSKHERTSAPHHEAKANQDTFAQNLRVLSRPLHSSVAPDKHSPSDRQDNLPGPEQFLWIAATTPKLWGTHYRDNERIPRPATREDRLHPPDAVEHRPRLRHRPEACGSAIAAGPSA